jgi:adenylate cyclase class IV
MARNIEIKARVVDIPAFQTKASQISSCEPAIIEQEDIFFNAPNGRLKLRIFGVNTELKDSKEKSQLIFYARSDTSGPKCSSYSIYRSDDPAMLKETLSLAYGIKGIVKKRRLLYLSGQTRIHLDEVETLGTFMELEVVLQPDQSLEEGTTIARDLMVQLGVKAEDCLEGAYMDLLAK